jgi:hypothetical protein
MRTATIQPISTKPAMARRAARNAPITDEVRETVAHRIHAAASYLVAAQAEFAFGPTGRVGHLAAHLEDAFLALEDAREAFVRASGADLFGADLSAFGWRAASADEGEAAVT